MKKGDKYQHRKSRRVVTIKGTYKEGRRTVINFTHYGAPDQVAAMYDHIFEANYKKK